MSGPIMDLATVAQTVQLVNQWNEQAKDAAAWRARNAQEFSAGDAERLRQQNILRDEEALANQKFNLQKNQLGLESKQFDIAAAQSQVGRMADAAIEQSKEESAGAAGRAVKEFTDYYNSLGARAGDYVDEAKDFTDPLIAAAPGSTVTGSRYSSDFETASGPASWARDPRKAEIAAYATALAEAPTRLSGIGIAQAGQAAQEEEIARERQLAGLDTALASAGVSQQLRDLGGAKTDLEKAMSDLARLDKSQGLTYQQKLSNIARSYGRTLKGQQNPQLPVASVLGNIANLSWLKPTTTSGVTPQGSTGFFDSTG